MAIWVGISSEEDEKISYRDNSVAHGIKQQTINKKQMTKKQKENYAFIDSQNLNLSIQRLGWKLDYRRFRVYLKDKYKITEAYLFIGFLPENQDLYNSLQKQGYILVFKPTLKYRDGRVKGNCDAELVLQAMIDFKKYEKAVIVSGDGDFHCLIHYLAQQKKLEKVLIPDGENYSALLKRFGSALAFLSDLGKKLEYKKRPKKGNKKRKVRKGKPKNKKRPVRTKP